MFLKLFYVHLEKTQTKLPVMPVRKEKAFVNAAFPNLLGLPIIKEKDWERRPDKTLWKEAGLKPTEFKMLTYPTIDPNAWFTYRKIDDKIKRVTLAEAIRKRGKG